LLTVIVVAAAIFTDHCWP